MVRKNKLMLMVLLFVISLFCMILASVNIFSTNAAESISFSVYDAQDLYKVGGEDWTSNEYAPYHNVWTLGKLTQSGLSEVDGETPIAKVVFEDTDSSPNNGVAFKTVLNANIKITNPAVSRVKIRLYMQYDAGSGFCRHYLGAYTGSDFGSGNENNLALNTWTDLYLTNLSAGVFNGLLIAGHVSDSDVSPILYVSSISVERIFTLSDASQSTYKGLDWPNDGTYGPYHPAWAGGSLNMSPDATFAGESQIATVFWGRGWYGPAYKTVLNIPIKIERPDSSVLKIRLYMQNAAVGSGFREYYVGPYTGSDPWTTSHDIGNNAWGDLYISNLSSYIDGDGYFKGLLITGHVTGGATDATSDVTCHIGSVELIDKVSVADAAQTTYRGENWATNAYASYHGYAWRLGVLDLAPESTFAGESQIATVTYWNSGAGIAYKTVLNKPIKVDYPSMCSIKLRIYLENGLAGGYSEYYIGAYTGSDPWATSHDVANGEWADLIISDITSYIDENGYFTGIIVTGHVTDTTSTVVLHIGSFELISKVTMTNGAYVRVNDPNNRNGIRFEANVNQADVEALASSGSFASIVYGIAIVPVDYLADGSSMESLRLANKTAMLDTSGFYAAASTDTVKKFWGSIVNIQASNYYRKFIGVAYIKIVDANSVSAHYIWSSYDIANARSLYDLAKAAYPVGTEIQKTALKAYLDGVVVIDENGDYAGDTIEGYTPAYTATKDGSTVTVTSTEVIKTVVIVSESSTTVIKNANLHFGPDNTSVTFDI